MQHVVMYSCCYVVTGKGYFCLKIRSEYEIVISASLAISFKWHLNIKWFSLHGKRFIIQQPYLRY